MSRQHFNGIMYTNLKMYRILSGSSLLPGTIPPPLCPLSHYQPSLTQACLPLDFESNSFHVKQLLGKEKDWTETSLNIPLFTSINEPCMQTLWQVNATLNANILLDEQISNGYVLNVCICLLLLPSFHWSDHKQQIWRTYLTSTVAAKASVETNKKHWPTDKFDIYLILSESERALGQATPLAIWQQGFDLSILWLDRFDLVSYTPN